MISRKLLVLSSLVLVFLFGCVGQTNNSHPVSKNNKVGEVKNQVKVSNASVAKKAQAAISQQTHHTNKTPPKTNHQAITQNGKMVYLYTYLNRTTTPTVCTFSELRNGTSELRSGIKLNYSWTMNGSMLFVPANHTVYMVIRSGLKSFPVFSTSFDKHYLSGLTVSLSATTQHPLEVRFDKDLSKGVMRVGGGYYLGTVLQHMYYVAQSDIYGSEDFGEQYEALCVKGGKNDDCKTFLHSLGWYLFYLNPKALEWRQGYNNTNMSIVFVVPVDVGRGGVRLDDAMWQKQMQTTASDPACAGRKSYIYLYESEGQAGLRGVLELLSTKVPDQNTLVNVPAFRTNFESAGETYVQTGYVSCHPVTKSDDLQQFYNQTTQPPSTLSSILSIEYCKLKMMDVLGNAKYNQTVYQEVMNRSGGSIAINNNK